MARGNAGRRWAVIVLTLLLVGSGALWAFNHGPTPERWLASLTAALAEQLGVEVSIQSVRLAGIDRIIVHGLRIEGDVLVEGGRVVAAFSVGEFWRNREMPWAALRWVSVDDWQVTLPADTLYEVEARMARWTDDSDRVARADDESLAEKVPDAERDPRQTQLPALGELTEALLGHQWVDGTLDVYLRDGRIAFADETSGSPVLQLQVKGALELGEERLVLRHTTVGTSEWQATVNGAVWPRPDVYVNVSGVSAGTARTAADFVHNPDKLSSFQLPLQAGMWQGEAWFTGHWEAIDAWGLAQLRSVAIAPEGPRRDLGEPGAEHARENAPAVYEADDIAIEWGYRPGRGVEVALNAVRDDARLHMQGHIAGDGQLNVAVSAADLWLPGHVPSLGRWDVSGRVDVSGTLRGTLREPVLLADVVSDGGYLFGQPFSNLQGTMQLATDLFAFERVRVTQGSADYYLDGSLEFSDAPYLDLVLQTDNGRAEALTEVLGWDVPLQAGLAGTLEFTGALGAVAAQGELTLTRGSAWGQPFDSLTGRFRYGGGAFAVTDVRGTVRGGTLTASGGSLEHAASGWEVQLVVEDVPIQASPLLRERLPMVTGLFGFEGTLGSDGTVWTPRLAGVITGRHVFIGSFDFVDAAGEITWSDGTLSSKGLTLRRPSGGVYDVTGHVYDVLSEPRLDIAVGVHGESVGQLLALTDWRLPLLAHSEPVQAEALLQGTLESPEATIHVETDAVYVVGRPVPLDVDLRLKNGRIEVDQLSAPTSRT